MGRSCFQKRVRNHRFGNGYPDLFLYGPSGMGNPTYSRPWSTISSGRRSESCISPISVSFSSHRPGTFEQRCYLHSTMSMLGVAETLSVTASRVSSSLEDNAPSTGLFVRWVATATWSTELCTSEVGGRRWGGSYYPDVTLACGSCA